MVGTTLLSEVSIPVVIASYNRGQQLRSETGAIVAELMTDRSFDATPPTLDLPAHVVVDATSPDGALVTYSVSATDDFDLSAVRFSPWNRMPARPDQGAPSLRH